MTISGKYRRTVMNMDRLKVSKYFAYRMGSQYRKNHLMALINADGAFDEFGDEAAQ